MPFCDSVILAVSSLWPDQRLMFQKVVIERNNGSIDLVIDGRQFFEFFLVGLFLKGCRSDSGFAFFRILRTKRYLRIGTQRRQASRYKRRTDKKIACQHN